MKVSVFLGETPIEFLIERLKRMVDLYYQHPTVTTLAHHIMSNCPNQGRRTIVRCVQTWVQNNIRYVRDPKGMELFQAPYRTIQRAAGDCDDHSILTVSILKSMNIPVRMKLIDQSGGGFNHVYTQALIHHRWVALDTIKPEYTLGWEARYMYSKTFRV